MRVRVLLFAALAQRLGTREEWLELPSGASAGAVWARMLERAPDLGELGRTVLLAVNSEFCGAATPLREGDEVALLPPMSGGAPAVITTGLVRGPLGEPPQWSGGAFGAVVCFEGVARNHAGGQQVLGLEYEAYEAMAARRLAEIAADAAARWPLTHIQLLHRLGAVAIGEASVRVQVASAHRAEAFEACRFLIDTLKKSVPIWKREHFADGDRWVEGEVPH